MDCQRESRRPLWILIGSEAVVTAVFIAAIWADQLTATAGKFAWTGIAFLVLLVVAVGTERLMRWWR